MPGHLVSSLLVFEDPTVEEDAAAGGCQRSSVVVGGHWKW